MPRQPRLDAPGVLHHIMARGIEGSRIFRRQADRKDFVRRVAELCEEEAWWVYAWALLPNHVHLLVRTGNQSLSTNMRRLLTGYVVNFNLKYDRQGHLFQNRYKSILCEDDPYLLELTRYIHLNPLRSGLVRNFEALNRFPWSGHSVLAGEIQRPWQASEEVLSYFGSGQIDARRRYLDFVRAGISLGRRPELVGGGLVRSAGGWSEVLSLRRQGAPISSDERVLGSSEFVESLLADAEKKQQETLRLKREVPDLDSVAARASEKVGVSADAMRSGIRRPEVVRARRLFCQMAVKKLGYSGAEVARYLGMATSSANRLAGSEILPELAEE